MSHSNICISSVFLDRAGEWKLGGLELLQADDDSVDSRIQLTTPIKYQPPEVSQGRRGHVWSADMWGLGCLVWEVYNGELTRPEKLKEVGAIPKKLLGPFVKLIGANPKSRPSPKQFLSEARAPGKYLQVKKTKIIRQKVFGCFSHLVFCILIYHHPPAVGVHRIALSIQICSWTSSPSKTARRKPCSIKIYRVNWISFPKNFVSISTGLCLLHPTKDRHILFVGVCRWDSDSWSCTF